MRSLFAVLLIACGAAATEKTVVPSTGIYAGSYSVPVPTALSASASYTVDEIEWSFVNGTATLSYKLPVELLGKSQRVSFSGPFDTTGTLVGEAGTADCSLADRVITCHEDMHALKPIEHDLDRVVELAPANMASDRVAVTRVFISDPIGIATFSF